MIPFHCLHNIFGTWFNVDGELDFGVHLQAIQEQMRLHGQEPVSFHDVKDEIFDMVKPDDPFKLTLQDLINRFVQLWIPYAIFYLFKKSGTLH